jgi:hypothetical protein
MPLVLVSKSQCRSWLFQFRNSSCDPWRLGSDTPDAVHQSSWPNAIWSKPCHVSGEGRQMPKAEVRGHSLNRPVSATLADQLRGNLQLTFFGLSLPAATQTAGIPERIDQFTTLLLTLNELGSGTPGDHPETHPLCLQHPFMIPPFRASASCRCASGEYESGDSGHTHIPPRWLAAFNFQTQIHTAANAQGSLTGLVEIPAHPTPSIQSRIFP